MALLAPVVLSTDTRVRHHVKTKVIPNGHFALILMIHTSVSVSNSSSWVCQNSIHFSCAIACLVKEVLNLKCFWYASVSGLDDVSCLASCTTV